MTPLMRAFNNGHLDIVKVLIDNGADVDDKDVVSDMPINNIWIKLIYVLYRLEILHSYTQYVCVIVIVTGMHGAHVNNNKDYVSS